MNQLLSKLILFGAFVVLAGSILLVWPAADLNNASAQTAGSNSSIFSNSNAAPPRPPFVDDFVYEFDNVPSYEEKVEATNNGRKNAKLIEIGRFVDSDTPWPSYSAKDLNELGVTSGENWLGLYEKSGDFFFANTKVTRSSRTGYVGPGDESYDWLKYERKGFPVFIFKDMSELKPGKVTTLFWNKPSDDDVPLDVGFRRSFRLNSKEYTLRVSSGLQSDGGKTNVLILDSEGVSQLVTFNLYYKDDYTLYNTIGDLIWVGDMDGDGKLDLYFSDFNFEKGSFGSNLYLSSPAKDGKLVKHVAGFGSAGC